MNHVRLTPFATGCLLFCVSAWLWGWHVSVAPLRVSWLIGFATCLLTALPLLVRPANRRHAWDWQTVALLTPVIGFGLLAIWVWSIVDAQ